MLICLFFLSFLFFGWGQLVAYLNVICFLIMFTQLKVRAAYHNSSCTASEEYRGGSVDGQQDVYHVQTHGSAG